MTPLFRYWLIPGRLRRLHIAARIAIAFVIILLTAVLSEVILKQKAAAFQNPSLVMIPAHTSSHNASVVSFGKPPPMAR